MCAITTQIVYCILVHLWNDKSALLSLSDWSDLAAYINRSVLLAVVIGEVCTQTQFIDCLGGSQSLMSEMPPDLQSAVCQLVN